MSSGLMSKKRGSEFTNQQLPNLYVPDLNETPQGIHKLEGMEQEQELPQEFIGPFDDEPLNSFFDPADMLKK